MNQDLEKFNSLIDGASKVIANPSKSLKETMGLAMVGSSIATSAIIMSASTISAMFSPVVGGAILIGRIGERFFRKKREQEEKDRMYQEVIRKQQAAINKQKEINRKLEEELRKANKRNDSNKQEIEELKRQIQNLKEVIDILTNQKKQFDMAA